MAVVATSIQSIYTEYHFVQEFVYRIKNLLVKIFLCTMEIAPTKMFFKQEILIWSIVTVQTYERIDCNVTNVTYFTKVKFFNV